MKLLVSIKDLGELDEALYGGADIIDVKDTIHGSLGLPRYNLIKDVALKLGNTKEKSVPVGDVESHNNALGYIARAVEELGYDYVKIGLKTKSLEEALNISNEVISSISGKIRVILVGYADYQAYNVISPMDVIDVANKVNAFGVMIDTLGKRGLSTFDYLTMDYLTNFVRKAKDYGLLTALAGGLGRTMFVLHQC